MPIDPGTLPPGIEITPDQIQFFLNGMSQIISFFVGSLTSIAFCMASRGL